MKYLVFQTEQEALEAEAAISSAMGFAKPGVNAATGQLDNAAITERWAIPQQVQDGRWVFPSPDNTGSQVIFETQDGRNIDLTEIVITPEFETFAASLPDKKPDDVDEVSWLMSIWLKFLAYFGIK